MTERLGIFGGTFDPVHVAHLVAALEARDQCGLDQVLLLVANDPWQKHGQVVAPAEARYEMVAAAIDDVDGLEPSRLELDRAGPTYTIDTVESLTRPDQELVLIVGRDVASRLDTWHRSEVLRSLVSLAIVDRDGSEVPIPSGWTGTRVTMPRLDVSSTDVRDRVARGASVDFLVPPPAVRVMRAKRLYTRR